MALAFESYLDVEDGKTYERLGPVRRVITAHDNYIVYLGPERLHYAESEHHFDAEQSKSFNSLWSRAMELQSRPTHNLTPAEQEHAQTTIGNAVGTALDLDFDGAAKMLDQADEQIRSQSTRKAVNLYALSVAAFGIASMTIALLYLLSRGTVDGMTEIVETLVVVSLGGSAGTLIWAFISKNRSASVDPYATRPWVIFSGFVRFMVGILGAFIVIIAVRIGLVTSELIDAKQPFWGYLFFAAAGGFSERWAPLLISKITPSEDDAESPANNGR